jgi:hypothetical protein
MRNNGTAHTTNNSINALAEGLWSDRLLDPNSFDFYLWGTLTDIKCLNLILKSEQTTFNKVHDNLFEIILNKLH